MRLITRLFLAVFVAVLAVGPALAAPLTSSVSSSVAAPAEASPSLAALLELAAYGLVAFGAIKVKDVGTIAKKFVRNAGAASGDYTEGVKGAGAAWEQGARDGAQNYKDGVAQASAAGRFEKGIAKAGAGKYVHKASTLGPQRYSTGVAAAEGEFAKGMGPVLQTIAGVSLPPRRPKGDPGNMQRSAAVAAALRALKVGQ